MEYKLLNKNEYNMYLPQIQQLFEICFEKQIKSEYLKWRYLLNNSDDILVYVAVENEKVVANYSAFPCELNINGKKVKSALSMTTMTHPKFKGKGIFQSLAKLLYEEMRKRKYEVVFGFPNNNSHNIFINKLGWKDIYEIPSLSLFNVNVNRINSKYDIELDNDFILDYRKIINKNSKMYLYKDESYLNWRFTQNPINKYYNYIILNENILLANCVVKYYNNEMDIVDINYSDEDAIKVLINNVISLNSNNIKRVNTWINVNQEIHGIFEKLGFINQAPITYFSAKILNKEIQEQLLYNYKEWIIQMSDSDVY